MPASDGGAAGAVRPGGGAAGRCFEVGGTCLDEIRLAAENLEVEEAGVVDVVSRMYLPL